MWHSNSFETVCIHESKVQSEPSPKSGAAAMPDYNFRARIHHHHLNLRIRKSLKSDSLPWSTEAIHMSGTHSHAFPSFSLRSVTWTWDAGSKVLLWRGQRNVACYEQNLELTIYILYTVYKMQFEEEVWDFSTIHWFDSLELEDICT